VELAVGLPPQVVASTLAGFHMTVSRVVSAYVDAALEQLKREDLMRWPGALPDAMRDPSIVPSDDWIGWKAIPSTVTSAELDALEEATGLAFPPLYREFLSYRHFVELTQRGVAFERHLSHDWSDTLRRAYFASWPRERILDAGLLPFGRETLMDAGPVCFDTQQRLRTETVPWSSGTMSG
jgi:hypothetical protein